MSSGVQQMKRMSQFNNKGGQYKLSQYDYWSRLANQEDACGWSKIVNQELEKIEQQINVTKERQSKNIYDKSKVLETVDLIEQQLHVFLQTYWKSLKLECKLLNANNRKKQYFEKKLAKYDAKISQFSQILQELKNPPKLDSTDSDTDSDDNSCISLRDPPESTVHTVASKTKISKMSNRNVPESYYRVSNFKSSFDKKMSHIWKDTNKSLLIIEQKMNKIPSCLKDTTLHNQNNDSKEVEQRDDDGDMSVLKKKRNVPLLTCLDDQSIKESWSEFWR